MYIMLFDMRISHFMIVSLFIYSIVIHLMTQLLLVISHTAVLMSYVSMHTHICNTLFTGALARGNT